MNLDDQFPEGEEFSEGPEEKRKRRSFSSGSRLFNDYDLEAFDEEYALDFDEETEALAYMES